MNRNLKWFYLAGIGWVLLTGTVSSVFAQNNAWQPLRGSTRGAISHPLAPSAGNSFYPTIRPPAASMPRQEGAAAKNQGWVNLGNGARIRLPENQGENTNKLSAEVLETIRQLKEQTPEARFQMATPSPVTGNVANSLVPPSGSGQTDESETDIALQGSYLSFPANKNIKISSLDFRGSPATKS